MNKLVIKLSPTEQCLDVPREICNRSRPRPRKVLKPNRYQVSKRAKVKKTCFFLLTVFCYAMINHTNGKCFLTMCSVFKCYANVISNFTIFGTNNLTMPVWVSNSMGVSSHTLYEKTMPEYNIWYAYFMVSPFEKSNLW